MATIEQKQAQQAKQHQSGMTTADNTQRQRERSTEQIIRELRQSGPLGPLVNGLMLAAARRLEVQDEMLNLSLDDVQIALAASNEVKQKSEHTSKNVRPEPSRLEIAAMFMAGSWAGNDSSLLYDEAWVMAGALIAVSKK